ncbi:MAG: glycerate kinase [Phycisphaerae bacterium]|nr:MAG: glycerate kinase [Phycisphaerae bacterium]
MVDAGDPRAAVRRAYRPPAGRVRLVASGKAAAAMADEALALLPAAPVEGVATVPEGVAIPASLPAAGVSVFRCDHPVPTERNMTAAGAVLGVVERVEPDETAVVLISGGASAHLCLPSPGLSVQDIAAATVALQRAGASIRELNCVRKHAEQLKGGRLAAACRGAMIAYILSDVVGDSLDVIASGPTAADPTTYTDALAVLDRYRLADALPAVTTHLRRGVRGEMLETIKPGDSRLARCDNRVIAGNGAGIEAVAARLRAMGYRVVECRTGVEGEASDLAAALVERAAGDPCNGEAPRVWVLGGEWTVTVNKAPGAGGPSQEFALAAAKVMAHALRPMGLLAFSSDGIDGPTDAAGAFVTHETWGRLARTGLDPEAALAQHDSHRALDAAGVLLRPGPTGTNINHVAVLAAW